MVFSATAVDGKGRPVTDLRRDEFRVYDEGRPSRSPISRGPGAAGPRPAAGGRERKHERGVEGRERPPGRGADPGRPRARGPGRPGRLRQPSTGASWPSRETRRRSGAGSTSVTPFGSTALHDALDKAARDIASHGEGRRAVVVLTDGVDTSSQSTAEEVIARSRALDVPIYAVSVVSPLDDPGSEQFLGQEGRGRGRGRGGDARPLRQPLRAARRSASATSLGLSAPPTGSRTSSSTSTAWARTRRRDPPAFAASR